VANTAFGTAHLPFPDHLHDLDSGKNALSVNEAFETQHRSGDPFYRPVILLNDVVEILALAQGNVGVEFGIETISVKYKNQSRVEASSVASQSVAAP